ncbi:glycosyltransferase family 2 protein [Qipengyuania sp. MTN3-11]|uniref:glycosyltransferase family 2 protein n=1 Tax=Qipengyuania sp. MTN3-11 TaxID=3056557 RepID=UPI0036F2436F
MTISVCTLAHGRDEHLQYLVRGLNHSRRPPCELVVAAMQDRRYELPETGFPIRQIVLGTDAICLAKARNVAAEHARGEMLVFLDVDCIPAPSLIQDYAAALALEDGIFMGEVGYLPSGATVGGIDFETFEELAVEHSERAGPPPGFLGSCEDYRCFWSLNFAMRKATFAQLGGFDEDYVGYGGEDTDFGRVATSNGVPLWWVRGAKAYHQYHKHHMPPVHHLDSVLANAAVFARKWGHSTMDHWLRAFSLMGLIESDGSGGWRKLRDPSEAHLALTRQQEHQPYASSAWVLEKLEDQESRGSAASRAPAMTAA